MNKILMLMACTFLSAPALAGEPEKTAAPIAKNPATTTIPALKKTLTQNVCMVTDVAYDAPQIAVLVEGKTYYGCCMMCKDRLLGDPSVRQAIDPISGKVVDKASAIIGAGADGHVYYFENEQNLAAFKPEAESKPETK